MTGRNALSRLPLRLESGARTNSTAALAEKLAPEPPPNADAGPADDEFDGRVNFTDTKKLFSSVPSSKLLRSVITLRLAATPPVADFGIWVMKSKLMEGPLCRKAILGVTERTFYRQFCAGKDLAAANATARELWETGLTAMLDYGLEHAKDNESCDVSMEEFLRTIESAKSVDSPVSFHLI